MVLKTHTVKDIAVNLNVPNVINHQDPSMERHTGRSEKGLTNEQMSEEGDYLLEGQEPRNIGSYWQLPRARAMKPWPRFWERIQHKLLSVPCCQSQEIPVEI